MRSQTFVTLGLLASLSLAARADLQVAIGNGNRVDGSAAAGRTDTYVVDVPADSKLIVTLKGLKSAESAKPAMQLEIRDPDGAELFSTPTAKSKVKGKAETTVTGAHRLIVSSDDAGVYQIGVKWRSPKKQGIALSLGATPSEQSVSFGADVGATLSLKVKPSKRSDADPRFDRIAHTAGGETDLPDPLDGEKGHKLKNVVIDTFGEQQAFVANDGAAGDVKGSIKIKAPKPEKILLDVTDEAVGNDDGFDGFAGFVTPKGGSVEAEGDGAGDIQGAAVDVDPGAVTDPVMIVIARDRVELQPPSEDEVGAGPTVFFGPEGKVFVLPVRVTIPYDPDVFMGDLSGLKVYTRDANGVVSLVPGPYDTTSPGVVTVSVTHFSSFRVVGPAPPPPSRFDLNDDGVDDLVVPAPVAGGSSEGKVFVFFGPFTADRTSAGADVTISSAVAGSEFGRSTLVADLDFDGVADLAVGSDLIAAGQVHIFLGGSSFSPSAPGDADFVISGVTSGDKFGVSLAAGETQPSGGRPNLFVGAEGFSSGRGRVYQFVNTPPQVPAMFPASAGSATGVWTGEVAGDLFGADIAVGNVSGNGVPDLVVAADMVDTVDREGGIYVFVGPGPPSGPADSAIIRIRGDTALGGFGTEVEVGDVTDDGVGDIVVAEVADTGTPTGAVYVFDGAGLTPTLPDPGSAIALQTRRYLGNASDDRLGSSLRLADLGGTGLLTILATAPNHDGLGALYEIAGSSSLPASGAVGPTQASIVGEAGGLLSVLLDPIDSSGGIRITAGAPTFSTGAGRVYLFQTPRSSEASASLAEVTIDGAAGDSLGGGD